MSPAHQLLFPFVALLLSACAGGGRPPVPTVDYVDLERFMGDWYVIASIPTVLEKGAHNAVETYALNPDGSIATTFVFHKDGFDGERKEYTPKGFVRDSESNAIWGMQFIWPIKADYRIAFLDDEYTQTVIARNKRDHVWVMARKPAIPQADYEAIVALISDLGYDVSALETVPQRW